MRVLRVISNILSPAVCIVCNSRLSFEEEKICLYCKNDLPLTYFWEWQDNPAEIRLWGRCYVEWVTSLFFYRQESYYKELIHKIKYENYKELGLELGAQLGRQISNSSRLSNSSIDYIVPVPTFPLKKIRRGYNQAEIIAMGVSSEMSIPVVKDLLRRRKYSRSQTSVALPDKWSNIKNDFSVNSAYLKRGEFSDKHILLVDDVLTSGSTIEACYNSLAQIEGIKVSVATLAFVE